jgi:hypothetical protein
MAEEDIVIDSAPAGLAATPSRIDWSGLLALTPGAQASDQPLDSLAAALLAQEGGSDDEAALSRQSA